MAMSTSTSTKQAGAEGRAAPAMAEQGERASETPVLLGHDEVTWGPAPDAFPAGAQLCVLHGDPGAPGAMFSVRLKAAQRYVFAPHCHPHDEHITVISGHLELGNGSRLDHTDTRTLGPGDYAFLPKDRFHYAWSGEEETVFQVQAIGPFAITYARPEDDPRHASDAH
jgi:quercetin dioxygenase-like cupin family protein